VTAGDGLLRLRVEDRGSGFDPAAALAGGRCSGLPGMRERAELLGGRVEVASAPGAGTCISAELPLRPAREGPEGSTPCPGAGAPALPRPADVRSLDVRPAAVALRGADDARQLVLTAALPDGRLQDLTGDVKYEVADPKVARVTSAGRVVPLANGSTTVTAR